MDLLDPNFDEGVSYIACVTVCVQREAILFQVSTTHSLP
jgi:hypothetical protein